MVLVAASRFFFVAMLEVYASFTQRSRHHAARLLCRCAVSAPVHTKRLTCPHMVPKLSSPETPGRDNMANRESALAMIGETANQLDKILARSLGLPDKHKAIVAEMLRNAAVELAPARKCAPSGSSTSR